MWLIQTINPATTAYNMGVALRLRGKADIAALSDSIDELCARHEILRSRVRLIDDRPHQVIESWAPGNLLLHDLTGRPDADSAAEELVNTDLRRVFDLGNEPVVRARLIKIADDSLLFGLVLHHIAGDQWSMGVFGRELSILYNQRRAGTAAVLEPLPVSYLDYARAGFHDQQAFARIYGDVTTDQLVEWDLCREMSFRIAWKPYMYNPTLPHLLGGVRAPALVVWGDDDKIVPKSAGERYAALLPKARLVTVRAAGHCVEMEQPDELATLVSGFIDEN